MIPLKKSKKLSRLSAVPNEQIHFEYHIEYHVGSHFETYFEYHFESHFEYHFEFLDQNASEHFELQSFNFLPQYIILKIAVFLLSEIAVPLPSKYPFLSPKSSFLIAVKVFC